MDNQAKGCFWMLLIFPELAVGLLGAAGNVFAEMSEALFGDPDVWVDEDLFNNGLIDNDFIEDFDSLGPDDCFWF